MANMAFDISTAVSLRNFPEQNLPDCDNTTVNNDPISPEATPQVYLSVFWQNEQLGVACYDVDTTEIRMMFDTQETDNFLTLLSVIAQVQPTYVILSAKQDERILKVLQNFAHKPLEAVPEKDLDYIKFLPSIDSVRAAGSLIKYLEKNRIGIELEDINVRVPFVNIQVFSLNDQVIIDNTALSALQIFRKESHPSVYKSGQSCSKEGFSLFGILNRCKSQLGSKLLRRWFLSPTKNVEILQQRHSAIAYFINKCQSDIVRSLEGCLLHIRSISRILSRMKQAQVSIGDWQRLYKTVYHAIYLADICKAQDQQISVFKKISSTFTEDLYRIASLINKIVDFTESKAQNRFVVKANVDQNLDDKKRTYNGLPSFMTEVAKEELNHLSEDITECNVVYLPQLGYLLAIPCSDNLTSEAQFHIPGLEFVFLSNNMIHYKSASTRNLDKILGDTQCEITDHETAIMHQLQDTILEHCQVLFNVMDSAAELDCLIALSLCAQEFGYVQPIFTPENVIDIKAGRHPLQEIVSSPYVANDITSGGRHPKLKILTGPNASGKSVYLKQVALILYMSYIGSFIPAESPSTVCTVDRIFTRIKSQESVSVGLSTFMLDINQMSDCLRHATGRSLVIVDEFGKGTESVDGLTLLCASLRHWLTMENCPHVLVSTNFHDIIEQKLLPASPTLEYLTMETLTNKDEVVFLYQITKGFSDCSFANETALQAGLPVEIVERGKTISKLIQENKPIYNIDTAKQDLKFKWCQLLVERFLKLDLSSENLQAFLEDIKLSHNKINKLSAQKA
ncbi:mutS protein homolog 5-like isoform X1 [Octopus sinensis]|uniref:MutS protein homolog 5 n=1 Tax=Octopus sinensis TaxID=2607531 RepID=A0A6P7SNA8_9MOLL|nr:mutS protein homolog 5-like isoform X1 [Octopus sinensis]XP_036361531.1 mutS protein homolog 5-like isoform X1 [Octopus sinensis]